jgi:hypothetical protein
MPIQVFSFKKYVEYCRIRDRKVFEGFKQLDGKQVTYSRRDNRYLLTDEDHTYLVFPDWIEECEHAKNS